MGLEQLGAPDGGGTVRELMTWWLEMGEGPVRMALACMCMYNCFSMRTTVEIDDAQRAELLRLAAQRGEKGFSSVIREALELYIRQHRAKKALVAQALELEGSFSDEEADALESSVRKLRETWR
jgi:Arc/MetJ family transcription regulator